MQIPKPVLDFQNWKAGQRHPVLQSLVTLTHWMTVLGIPEYHSEKLAALASSEVGDCHGHIVMACNQPFVPAQPPTLNGMGNEYWLWLRARFLQICCNYSCESVIGSQLLAYFHQSCSMSSVQLSFFWSDSPDITARNWSCLYLSIYWYIFQSFTGNMCDYDCDLHCFGCFGFPWQGFFHC